MARGRKFRLWSVLAAACLMACGQAAADDLYTVSGVAVDRSAATPQQARDAAIADGERKAFDMLMRRLTDPSQASRLPHPADRDLAPLVQGFGVEQERASAARYVATISVSFQPDAIRQLLSAAGIPAVQVGGRPLLVLPVLHDAGGTLLWEDGNRWRQSWADHPPAGGLVPLIVPQGDADDIGSLDVGDAASGRPGALDAILKRYRTAGVLVAEATPDSAGVGLKVTQIVGGGRRDLLSDRVARGAGESDAALFARAAQSIGDLLEDRYRHDNIAAPGSGGTVTAQIPLDGLDGWLVVRRELQSVGLVQRIALRALSKREATVDIAFSGDQAQLASVLAQNGLRLEQAGEGWVLRGAASPAGARP